MGNEIISMMLVSDILNEVLLENYFAHTIPQETLYAMSEMRTLSGIARDYEGGLLTSVAAQNLYKMAQKKSDHSELLMAVLPPSIRTVDHDDITDAEHEVETEKRNWTGGSGYLLYCDASIGPLEADPYYLQDVVEEILREYCPTIFMVRIFGYSRDALYILRSDTTTVGDLRTGETIFDQRVAYISLLPLGSDDPCSEGVVPNVNGLPSEVESLYIGYLNEISRREGIPLPEVVHEEVHGA